MGERQIGWAAGIARVFASRCSSSSMGYTESTRIGEGKMTRVEGAVGTGSVKCEASMQMWDWKRGEVCLVLCAVLCVVLGGT